MNELRRFVFIPLVCAMAFGFAACDKDDGNANKDGGETEQGDGSSNNQGGQNGDANGSGEESIDTHEYVDLGLESGTLWATCNIGAANPEDYGDYFLWGETEANYVSPSNDKCRWCSRWTQDLITEGVLTGKEITGDWNLVAEYDVATVKWGSNWRMPTKAEIKELESVPYEETEVNGVKGLMLMGQNGNSLFFPYAGSSGFKSQFGDAGGFIYNPELYYDGEYGFYWSATVGITTSDSDILFVGANGAKLGEKPRSSKYTVRPVRKK